MHVSFSKNKTHIQKRKSSRVCLLSILFLRFSLNSVPEEQLVEFVEDKDHMIILNVFKNFPERENIVLLALFCLHSLAGPREYDTFFMFRVIDSGGCLS